MLVGLLMIIIIVAHHLAGLPRVTILEMDNRLIMLEVHRRATILEMDNREQQWDYRNGNTRE
jgi:hypothetical protein